MNPLRADFAFAPHVRRYDRVMPTIRLEIHLDCDPDHAWALVRSPGLLRHIAAPLVTFKPIDPPAFPERWEERRYTVAMRAFGVIPLGRQDVVIRFDEAHPDAPDGARTVRDAGSGDLMKTWDHWIFIAPHPEGGTRYIDQVSVEAGWLTPFAAVFARLFYVWRQHRWRGVVRRGLMF